MSRNFEEGMIHAGCVEILAILDRVSVAKTQATLVANRASSSDLALMERIGWLEGFGTGNARKYRITDAGGAVVRDLAGVLKAKAATLTQGEQP